MSRVLWWAVPPQVMKALRQLGFLKLPFRHDEPQQEEVRVMALFRNRAELKKQYGELQDEIYRLKDRVKQQEGATQRVQEMLSALESRLGNTETAFPALVFYQLRRLWQSGRELIEQFVADLARQQEDRERRLHFAELNRKQFARREGVQAQLRAAETQVAQAHTRVGELQAERATLTRFWHYFKRRALEQQVQHAGTLVNEADRVLREAREAAEQLENEKLPDFPGLSVESRRAINLAAIAYAEVLCLRLVKTELVSLAREATARRDVTDDYGSRQECETLMAEIARARTMLFARSNIAQEVKVRSERLKQQVRYRNPTDTTPAPDSISFSEGDVMAVQAVGANAKRLPNVLTEDSWDLFRVLLR